MKSLACESRRFLLNYLKVSVKVIVKRNIVRKFVVLTNKIKNYERIYYVFIIWRQKAFVAYIVSRCVRLFDVKRNVLVVMKCEIYRTSDWAGGKKPCKRAYKDISDNGIVTEWYIDINSLDDIQALIDEVDNPIIIKKDGGIEIYDDYRE